MGLLKAINKIIDLSEIGNFSERKDLSVQSFGLGLNTVNFINKNKLVYYETIREAFDYDTEIETTYTLKKYELFLINHFSDFMLRRQHAKQEDVTAFCKILKSEEKRVFSVFREIHGITLTAPQNPLKLGRYTIYEFESQKANIKNKAALSPDLIWYGDSPKYLIEWQAEARHFEKAIEISDQAFERFELVLRYVIGSPSRRFEVGVLNYQGWRNRRAYAFSSAGQVSSSSSGHGAFETIPLDEPYFIDEELGYKYAWDISTNSGLNKFQKRLLLAIEWIGQSMAEQLPQSAFLKSAIALEVIFTYSERSIITPSILNQISESVALILGKSVSERLELESKVKKLYGLRSSIVHSGNKSISESDHHSMLGISRAVVAKFLTSNTLRNIDSIEEMYKLLKKTKYSGSEI